MDVLKFPFNGIAVPIRNKPVILAVDNDEDNRVLAALAVEQLLDCRAIEAVDGETAISLAHLSQPDLILLDILLPDLNGKEVIRRLKQHPDTRAIPIIALTALALAQDRRSILAAGGDDYLSKPYMLEDLEAVIRCHLRMPSLI